MMDLTQFKALTFDCYGTLIDWETGISALVMPWMQATHPQITLDQLLITFAEIEAKHEQLRPALLYPEVLRRTWQDIEQTYGLEPDVQHAERFARSVGAWPPFADTVSSLVYLKRFYRLGILSNVDNASLEQSKRTLEVPIDVTVTAEDVGSYKPDLAHVEEALRRFAALGITKRDMLHVAQSKHHDITPTNAIGLANVWVNRRHGKRASGATLAAEAEPGLTVTSLAQLVDLHRRGSST